MFFHITTVVVIIHREEKLSRNFRVTKIKRLKKQTNKNRSREI
jgi:hypothetical protein